jgi:type I restriction enzyme S subunit
MGGEFQSLQLGTVCSKIGSGATPRGGKEAYRGGSTSLIRSQNIYNDRFVHDGLAFIDDDQADELRNVVVEDGDVLLNITGDSVARCCQVDPAVLPARVNQHVAIIRPKADILDARFLRYSLISPTMQARLLALASAGATRNALTKGMLEALDIAAPLLPEQRAIAHILGTLDDKIELNRRRNQTLEAMARALFQDWFVDFGPVRAKMKNVGAQFIAPDSGRDESRPYKLPAHLWQLFSDRLDDEGKPEGWEIIPANELIEFNPTEPLRKGTPAPYLDMASLPTSGSWPEPPVIRKFGSGMRFCNGDTLLARITPCLENGKTAFVQCLPDDAVGWGSTEYIVMRPRYPVPAEYAYLLARDGAFREHAIRSMTGTSGRQRAQGDSVAAFKLASPPDEKLWHAFARQVAPIFESIKSNAEASETLAQLRDTLLPKLISGELRIADAEEFLERVA